jgi:hypothetical protein
MATRDCTTHTQRVRLSLDPTKLKSKQRSNIIAAQLRQLADYTDGWCASEHAEDADLEAGKWMEFYFTTDEKRTLFKNRIGLYLRDDINTALTRLDG